jgi:asparagine synthase (glutamine-hydrolysing)
MSGICGLYNLDNAPVAEANLGAMVSMLEARGPDASGRWQDGPIGLGHSMLATTPESLIESQPYRHPESGCVITADVRLDYRHELIDALGLSRRDAVGDAELILRAYLKWGEGCALRLFGDFAFAIWDPRNRKLFCARDRFGLRPFYYHHVPHERFVFASETRPVLVLPQVPFALNQGRIADYIVQQLEWIDYTSTFFEGISRLPPAHTMTVSASGMRVSEYWAPDPGPPQHYATDDEYEEAFLEVFSGAVAERLRVPETSVGSMLSGGMDSGSIVAIAHGILAAQGKGPLPTYSLARVRGADCLESERIYATLDFLGLDGTKILADDPGSLREDIGANLDEPYDGQFIFMRAILDAAKQQNVKVVLDGAAGDIVFNEGAYIQRLLRRGRIKRAWHETAGEQTYWGASRTARYFARYLASAYVPDVVKRLSRRTRQRRNERAYVRASLISPEFADRVNIDERFERMRATFSGLQSADTALERVRKIRPNLTAGRERYGRIAAWAGVEGRDPFTDQRVVEFCAHLPDHLCARDGWPKFLLRKAMAGRLPDMVRWGRQKPHIGFVFTKTFIRHQESCGRLSLDSLQATLEGYIDPAKMQKAWGDFESGADLVSVYSALEHVQRACVLSLWLENFVTRPVEQS